MCGAASRLQELTLAEKLKQQMPDTLHPAPRNAVTHAILMFVFLDARRS
jgi:hypothetical protein